ncbi:hypothetical protein AUR04nite_22320 [Glutamicibacter uratoxydans]|uniref:FHA domain-containing protein n=1 Tax=Glutamicibacter uratoxydans TaxID=43667 RepID=A0A4Y4DT84_GLUUR|nr:RDD family protein [Glutamicibacter uratoxydans]GED06700.1 hypothetical protein AUR04nite_22320 [Glutamicibacter uratoxydans]
MAAQLKLVDASTAQRVLSWLIDGLPLFILWLVFMPRVMGKAVQATVAPEIIGQMMAMNLVLLAVSLGYTLFLWWWEATSGKTLGNVVMKIRTTDMEGQAPKWKGAIVRRLLIGLAGVIPIIGSALMAASNEFDKNGKRQGWHDKVAGTLVFDIKAGRNPLVSGGSDGPSSFAPPATNGRREFKDGDVEVEHDVDAAHSMILPLGTHIASQAEAKSAPKDSAPAAKKPAAANKPAPAKKPAAKTPSAKAPAAKNGAAKPAAKPEAKKPAADSDQPEVISSVPGAKKPEPAPKAEAKPAAAAPAKAPAKPAAKPAAKAAPKPAAAKAPAKAAPVAAAAAASAASKEDAKPKAQPKAASQPVAAKEPSAAQAPAAPPKEQPAAAPEIVQPATYDPDMDGGETRLRPAADVEVHLLFDDGADILVEESALIGRNPQPAEGMDVAELLVVDDPQRTVSKTHLLVAAGPQGVWVTDQGSANGTYISNADGAERKLEAGTPAAAVFGSIVHFGERYFKVSNS